MPVVDLRIKFNLAKVEYTPFTVVIILNVANRVIGMVVDSVSDVFADQPADSSGPDFSASFDTKYILGLASIDQRMLIVIDIAQLMTSRDMELIDDAGPDPPGEFPPRHPTGSSEQRRGDNNNAQQPAGHHRRDPLRDDT